VRNTSFIDETGLDADSTATMTGTLDVTENKELSWTVIGVTGTHTNHMVELECSNVSGTANFVAMPGGASKITGVGSADNISTNARFIRSRVITAQGTASTVRIVIVAK